MEVWYTSASMPEPGNIPHEPASQRAIPSLAELSRKLPQRSLSVTNLIIIDKPQGVVYKGFLKEDYKNLLGQGIQLLDAHGVIREELLSPEKAEKEARDLEVLRKIGIRVPDTLAEEGAFLAHQFVAGTDLSAKTESGEISEQDAEKSGKLLAQMHNGLKQCEFSMAHDLTPPSTHSANSVNLFDTRTANTASTSWRQSVDPDLAAQFLRQVGAARVMLNSHPTYRDFTDVVYGEAKDENIIVEPNGEFMVIDPFLCRGRFSMDVGKFLSRMAIKNPDAFLRLHKTFLDNYEQERGVPISRVAVAQMMAIDMLNALRSYIPIAAKDLEQIPVFVKTVQQNATELLSKWIPKLLEGSFDIEQK